MKNKKQFSQLIYPDIFQNVNDLIRGRIYKFKRDWISQVNKEGEIKMKTRQNKLLPEQQKKSTLRLYSTFLLILYVICGIITVTAQVTTPQRGVAPSGSYSISDIEFINNVSGNMGLKFPLGQLPAGRAGLSYGISLSYDSKIYNVFPDKQELTNPLNPNETFIVPTQKLVQEYNMGGWQYNIGYEMRVVEKNPNGGQQCPEELSDMVYHFKVQMRFPDGTLREMYPADPGGALPDGYSRIAPSGFRRYCKGVGYPDTEWWIDYTGYSTSGMVYYSTDGTFARLEVGYDGDATWDNNPWTLYLTDGTKVTNAFGQPQKIYDRNDNYLEIRSVANPTYPNNPSTEIVDQLNRKVILEYYSATEDRITAKGFNGADLTWRVLWKSILSNKTYASGENAVTAYDKLSSPVRVVDQIIQPTQTSSLTYTFGYNSNDYVPSSTTVSDGWGELSSITFPSGAEVEYEYALDGEDGLNDTNFVTEKVLKNRIVRKELNWTKEYDGATSAESEVWLYSPDELISNVSVTSPDGSVTTDYIDTTKMLSYKSVYADGSISERFWGESGIVNGGSGSHNIFGSPGGNNNFWKAEFNTIADSSGQPTQTAITETSRDKNGNVTKITQYDFVAYSSIPRNMYGRITGLPSGLTIKRITENTYNNPTPDSTDSTTDSSNGYWRTSSPRFKNAIAVTEVKDGSNNVVARTEFTYDNASTIGNLTGVKTWDSTKGSYSSPLTSGNSISIANQYDSYGNLTQTTDAKGIVSTLTYGNITTPSGTVADLYPTQSVTAYGTAQVRTTNMEYDFSSGAVTEVTDADNSVSTETEYDDLVRPTKVKAAVGTANEIWTQTIYDNVNRRVISKADLEVKGDAKKVAIQHFDQLGRVRLTRTLEDASTEDPTDEADGIKVQTRYKYDNPTTPASSNGIYSLTSNPYRATTSAGATSEEGMGWTLGYTDKTGKTLVVKTYGGAALPAPFVSSGANTNLTGTVTTEIDENTTKVTDQAGKLRRSVTNALGQLVKVDEPDDLGNLGTVSSPNQATSYTYDTLSNLTGVTQGSQTRTFSYSSLSRLTQAVNPESGTISYSYDNNGNLTSKTDARSVVTSYTYDNLNRVTQRSYSDSTPTVTYTYDDSGITYSKGRLTKVSSSVSETKYTSFDNLGRILTSQQITDSNTYNFGYSYNLSGALVEETYPSGRKVKNSFQVDGALGKVETKESAGSYTTRAETLSYTAAGAVSSMKLGNAKWENAVFNSRLQPTQLGLGTSSTDQSLWKVNYDYGTTNNNGNILSQTITVPTITAIVQTYTYDSLNRIKDATETVSSSTIWKQTFSYDRYGNRRFDTTGSNTTTIPGGCSTAQCNPTIDTANNRFTTGQGYTYDSSGNLLTDAEGRTFTYDAENKQKTVANSGGTIGTYSYDGDGKRVKKVSATETTLFVYDASGKMVAEYLLTEATPTSPVTSYLTSDTLGSPRVITDASGSIQSRRDFMPFGEEISAIGGRTSGLGYQLDATRQKFTGYERDNETDLDFAQARMFGNGLGRFTSPDPILSSGRLEAPQTWNRYAYVLNNPLYYIDPDGLYECKGESAQCTEFRNSLAGAKAKLASIGEQYGTNSEEYKKAERALNSYGCESVGGNCVQYTTDDNGNSVATTVTDENGKPVKDTSNVSVNFNRTEGGGFTSLLNGKINVSFTGNPSESLLTHEGSHVADTQNFLATGISKSMYQAEYDAHLAQSVVGEFVAKGNNSSRYRMQINTVKGKSYTIDVWNKSWETPDLSTVRNVRRESINAILSEDKDYLLTPTNTAGKTPAYFNVRNKK